MIEKRTKPRIRLVNPAETTVKAVFEAKMLDLSAEGALLEMDRPIPVSLGCSLRVRFEGEDYFLSATVKRSRLGGARPGLSGDKASYYLVGLEFSEATQDSARSLLERFPPTLAEGGDEDREIEFPPVIDALPRVRWAHDPALSVSLSLSGAEEMEPHPLPFSSEQEPHDGRFEERDLFGIREI
jgi:hypothetical protein